MDYETAQRFKPYLAPHESVRWSGRPQQGITFRASDIFMIPFSLFWCGFAIFWMTMAVSSGAPVWFAGWGAPFVIIGLYIVFGRFIYDAFVRSRTYYALTQHSALILGGFDGKTLTTIDLKSLAESHLKPGDGDRGTIVFGPDVGQFGNRRRGIAPSPEFFAIENVASVYSQVQSQRRAA